MSPDGRFVTGPVPDLPGLWVASGCNGSGFSSSLGIGEALATWITTGTPPPGLTALSPARFGPLPDDTLVSRGLWQYAHYYDPAAPEPGVSLPEESAATPPPQNQACHCRKMSASAAKLEYKIKGSFLPNASARLSPDTAPA